ncbi:c-type cytochrome [Massilia sp. CT11-137]|uniref:c-type cytochrome n=1 Tax=Massilia sp. CT11-137 TaxID=3393901 RepID=UPI0039B0C0AB
MLTASLASAVECASPDACGVERGRKIFMTCAACHSIDPKGSFTVGPNLRSVLNRPIGKAAGFHYSAALQKARGNWTPAALDAFLTAPSEAHPGTSMAFAGLKKPDDRAAVISYLKQLAENKE